MTVDATSARTELPFGNLRVRLRQALVRFLLRFAVLLPFLCCGPLFSVCRFTTERHHATQYGINASLPSSGLSVVHATPQDFAREDWPGPSTQAYLLRTIFRRRYSPRFRSNRSTTIDKGLPAPVYFRRSYSHEFRSGSRIHRRRRTCSRPHVPSMLLLMVLLRKARPRPSTQGCLLQSTCRRRYSPSEPAPDHLPSTLLS